MRRHVEPRGRARRAVAGLVLVLGLCLLTLQLTGVGADSDFPDRPADAMSKPIGRPPAVSSSDEYAFIRTQPGHDDEPVTYDPCAPIHLVVNDRTAMPGSSAILREALDSVTAATGLRFVVDGSSERRPKDDRKKVIDDHPGGGWRPALVAWSDPARTPALAGDVAGVGGSTAVRRDGREWFVTGDVTLDGPQLSEILASPGGRASVRAVVMHELGHLVGLDHVQDRDELMFATGSPRVTDWGPGDRTGLAALGSGRCIDY